jgi:pimeloyl-ACP methyl ester carboxylesterase
VLGLVSVAVAGGLISGSTDAYPADTAGRRPNRQKVYSVRLSAEEEAEVQRVAAAKHLPASTLVRSWILERLDRDPPPSQSGLFDRYAATLNQISNDEHVDAIVSGECHGGSPQSPSPSGRMPEEDLLMSTFVIVPGAWDTPATLEPVIEPLGSAGHDVIVVDLPCENADASLQEYADAVRAVLPDDLTQVVLVGYSFGGFTASRIAVDHPDVPVVYVAAWIPRDGSSVLDLFVGGDPFEAGEEAGIAAFDGLVLSAGPGLCALNIDLYVAAADPVERDAVRTYLERTQRPQGIAVLREKWRGNPPASPRRTYILTTADTLVPPEAQRVMAASVGAEVIDIAADHGIFREQPARLAELLVAASR